MGRPRLPPICIASTVALLMGVASEPPPPGAAEPAGYGQPSTEARDRRIDVRAHEGRPAATARAGQRGPSSDAARP